VEERPVRTFYRATKRYPPTDKDYLTRQERQGAHMKYTLWDIETSNQFGQFEDEAEVLSLVRTLVNHYGPRYAEDLGLGRVSEDGVIFEPLSGAALIARVDEVLPDCRPAGELIGSRKRNRGLA
jgi:hypothetical protein